MILPLLQDASTHIQEGAAIAENTIYMMGTSFILGSVFTVLMLFILDVIRRKSIDQE